MPDDNELQQRLERLRRLRRLGVRRGAQDLPRPAKLGAAPDAAPEPRLDTHPAFSTPLPVSAILPGEPVVTPFGPAWVRTMRYPLAGRPDLAEWLTIRPEALAALDRNDALLALDPAKVAFIDTETTGLSLGTGTYTFLIGVGTYESGAFVVRQFFMRNPAEERAQLHLVEEALGECTGIVSFNGRGFDMPLIYNRFVLAGMPLPLAGAPHLDLLPPAAAALEGALGFVQPGQPGAQRARGPADRRGRAGLPDPRHLPPVLPHRRRDRNAGACLLP